MVGAAGTAGEEEEEGADGCNRICGACGSVEADGKAVFRTVAAAVGGVV